VVKRQTLVHKPEILRASQTFGSRLALNNTTITPPAMIATSATLNIPSKHADAETDIVYDDAVVEQTVEQIPDSACRDKRQADDLHQAGPRG